MREIPASESHMCPTAREHLDENPVIVK
jgi:hypothetical protein